MRQRRSDTNKVAMLLAIVPTIMLGLCSLYWMSALDSCVAGPHSLWGDPEDALVRQITAENPGVKADGNELTASQASLARKLVEDMEDYAFAKYGVSATTWAVATRAEDALEAMSERYPEYGMMSLTQSDEYPRSGAYEPYASLDYENGTEKVDMGFGKSFTSTKRATVTFSLTGEKRASETLFAREHGAEALRKAEAALETAVSDVGLDPSRCAWKCSSPEGQAVPLYCSEEDAMRALAVPAALYVTYDSGADLQGIADKVADAVHEAGCGMRLTVWFVPGTDASMGADDISLEARKRWVDGSGPVSCAHALRRAQGDDAEVQR